MGVRAAVLRDRRTYGPLTTMADDENMVRRATMDRFEEALETVRNDLTYNGRDSAGHEEAIAALDFLLAEYKRGQDAFYKLFQNTVDENISLREALGNLLDDTQHVHHADCDEGPCPVREARKVMEDR